ncbi:MAG TPA: VTT domain-containing protein [Afifellaceae bacterium]|nr:VTT domain-containing protein [Afifellaceae bacterium]
MPAADKQAEAAGTSTAALVKRFAPVAVIVAGLIFGYLRGWHEYLSLGMLVESREMLRAFVEGNFAMAAIGYVLIYIVAVAFSFPGASFLTIGGGFMFGWFIAGILTAIAAPIGATIIYLVARSAVGNFLIDMMKRKAGPRIRQLAEGFEEDAFSYLLSIRLAPIFPFWVINIAPAIFNVPLGTYFAATVIGILPGTFAYAFLGEGIDSVIAAQQAAGDELSIGDLVTPEITAAFVLLAVVSLIPTIVKKIRAARR